MLCYLFSFNLHLGTNSLLLDTQHPESIARIHEIENRLPQEVIVQDTPISPPKFVVQLQDYPVTSEGSQIHLEARIQPTTDPNLTVQWYHNGQPLMTGHRFKTTHDFGYVSLDIIYSFPEDSGVWTCRAVNSLGVDETSANIQIQGHHTLILDTQHPQSWKKIQQIEAPRVIQTPAPEPSPDPPKFTQHLERVERYEGQSAHFECRLLPISDPTLIVEWYHNGKPMTMANRFKPTFDFGYVSLDMSYVFPEDSGTYIVRALNSVGEATSITELIVYRKSFDYIIFTCQ